MASEPSVPGLERPWEIIAAGIGRPFDEARWQKAIAQKRVVLEDEWGAPFWRFRKDVGHVDRGSVVCAEGFLWEFPHIARIAHLARGIQRTFPGSYLVEEKVDGYNVRIARVGGRALAFSRNGRPCPFATDRLRDFPGILALLDARPGAVVCAEVAGPGNPYNVMSPPWVEGDIAMPVFDLGAFGPRGFLGPEERAAVCARHGVAEVRSFGRFRPGEAVRVYEVVRQLDAEGGEGIVMKAEDGGARLKYYCLGTNTRDLRSTAGLLGSVDASFIINHLVQAACTLHEWEQGGDDAARRALGAGLMDAMLEALGQVEPGGEAPDGADPLGGFVEERFTVRFHDADNADRLVARMGRSATVQVRELARARDPDGMLRLELAKRYQGASGYFRTRLAGTAFID
jgi:putative ATP-dependent DNA ligase